MKILFLGASNTDCGHCFSEDNLGYGYVKMTAGLLSGRFNDLKIINGGTDGFTFPRIYQKWLSFWKEEVFDLAVILGGINEVGALMDSGCTDAQYRALIRRSSEALSALISGLNQSGCKNILVIEPFLFSFPEYLRSWQPCLNNVRAMIRDTLNTAGSSVSFSADAARSDSVRGHLRYLPVQELLDQAAADFGISVITKDGIHLSGQGHRILAEYLSAQLITQLSANI